MISGRTNSKALPRMLVMTVLAAGLAIIFLVDVTTPGALTFGMLYVVLVLVSMITGSIRTIVTVAVVALALSILGFFLGPETSPETLATSPAGNRILNAMLIVASGIFAVALTLQSKEASAARASQRETREHLESLHQMLEMATELTGVGGWSIVLAEDRIHWTDEVRRIHEVPEDFEPTLSEGIDFYAPEYRDHIRELFERCVNLGEPYDAELQIITANNRRVWARAVGQPLRDANGTIIGAHGALVDIDEQKRARQLLEESKQQASALSNRLMQTLESMIDGFFTLDHDWRFTFINKVGESLLQRGREELIGRNVWEEFPEAAGTIFEEQYRHAMASGDTVAFNTWYEPLNTWFEVRAYPFEQGLAVHYQDITDRRRAEEELRLLHSSVDSINDIVMITEAEPIDEPGPRIVYVNPAFEHLTGFRRDEVIGKNPRILQGPDTSRKELDRIRRGLETQSPVQAQVLNYSKNGQRYWLEMKITPLADSTGKVTHFVAVERDITRRLAMEDQLRQSQRLEAIGHLTGGVAHDFNNLLTVILGNAELMMEQSKDQDEFRRLAATINAAAQRGADLTQRLLAFARRQPLNPHPVDVNRLIADMDELLRRSLGADIEIELSREAGLWPAMVDPAQFENALLNLCINSRDAMSGGGRLTIETANARIDREYGETPGIEPGQFVMVAVSDTGTGIDPDHIEHVFEPFFTTKKKGKGTGLGLSMVYGLIRQSGGQIKLYSEPGQGTTVRMYLPRASREAPQRDDPNQLQPIESGAETILVVEDDELVRGHVRDQLHSLGYQVLAAADGKSALDILEEREDIALLFTDVIMPGGMGGRELAEAARQMRPGLRVLFTSGYTENSIVHHGRLDPGVLLLSKPYRKSELARSVREALGRDGSENR